MTLLNWCRSGAATAALVAVLAGYSPVAAASPALSRSSAAALKGTKTDPAVEVCGLGKPETKPAYLILACADANTQGVHLSWTKWGPTEADATGAYTWNTCVPNCAASKAWDKAAANFTLNRPVNAGSKVGWLFEQLVVRITGKVPSYVKRVQTYNEAPVSSH